MATRPLRTWALFVACVAVSCSTKDASPGGGAGKPDKPASRLVFRDAQGRELTEADLAGATGQVNWEIVGGRNIPEKAKELHRRGREAGAAGEYDRALALFAQARQEAPSWPYPVYDAAFTYLLKGDAAKAEELYATVDKMAPRGFFTAKTALDCLRREKAGDLQPGMYKLYVLLEGEADPARKKAALQRLLKRSPKFAVAWKDLALLQEDAKARLEMIEKGLSQNPDGETRGILRINKALTLNEQGNRDEATRILGELALDPGSTLSTEHLAKAALATLLKKR